LNPASIFTSFMHNIHVKIIISLWYLSWGIVTNIFVHFSLSHLCHFPVSVIPSMFQSYISVICHQCYLSSYLCHMKYFPFSIWATWAHHISFHLITWHGMNPQLKVFPTSGRDRSSGTDHV
jgi:hypothetical protein